MKVLCIFAVANNLKNMQDIFNIFGNKIAQKLLALGATSIEIRFAGINYKWVGTNQQVSIIGQQKGEGILECLKGIDTDCVISCDGSGKIPYEYIVDIFRELTSDSSIQCVMANRINNKAISDFRYLIERFEIFSLKSYCNHNKEIPDGQCGLWGYKTCKKEINGQLKDIKLTAKGYDIELDLLGEILENEFSYSFIDVELPKQEQISTSFKYDNNLQKMKFLFNKHSKLKEIIPNYIKKFEDNENISIKLKDDNLKKEWENYKVDLSKL